MPDPLLLFPFFAPTFTVFVLFVDRDSNVEPRVAALVVTAGGHVMAWPTRMDRVRRKSSGRMTFPVSFRTRHGLGQHVLLVEDGDGLGGLADAKVERVNGFFIFADLTFI